MVKSIEEATRRFARGSIRAYLEGQKNLNWILGMIRSSGVRNQRLLEIFETFKGYGSTERYHAVLSACRDKRLLK